MDALAQDYNEAKGNDKRKGSEPSRLEPNIHSAKHELSDAHNLRLFRRRCLVWTRLSFHLSFFHHFLLTVLHIFAGLGKSLTQFPKADKLFRRKDATYCKLVHETDLDDLGLCQLRLAEPVLDELFVDVVGIQSVIESGVGLTDLRLCGHHQWATFHVRTADTLHLLRVEPELLEDVHPHFDRPIILRTSFAGGRRNPRFFLCKGRTRKGRNGYRERQYDFVEVLIHNFT